MMPGDEHDAAREITGDAQARPPLSAATPFSSADIDDWFDQRLDLALKVIEDALKDSAPAVRLKVAESIVARCAERSHGRNAGSRESEYEQLVAQLPPRAELRAAVEGKT